MEGQILFKCHRSCSFLSIEFFSQQGEASQDPLCQRQTKAANEVGLGGVKEKGHSGSFSNSLEETT